MREGVCRVQGQRRSTHRRVPQGRADEERPPLGDAIHQLSVDGIADMIELTRSTADKATAGWLPCYGPFGGVDTSCRRRVNNKCVERWWKREELKVPMKQPKKGRLWLSLSRVITS